MPPMTFISWKIPSLAFTWDIPNSADLRPPFRSLRILYEPNCIVWPDSCIFPHPLPVEPSVLRHISYCRNWFPLPLSPAPTLFTVCPHLSRWPRLFGQPECTVSPTPALSFFSSLSPTRLLRHQGLCSSCIPGHVDIRIGCRGWYVWYHIRYIIIYFV